MSQKQWESLSSPSTYEAIDVPEAIDNYLVRIDSRQFNMWYSERTIERNIRDGTPYFNGPRPTPDPYRHSPSRLLQCHRRVYYQLYNAPAETEEPTGVFWFGSHFETEIAMPFLQDLTDGCHYVRNSMWVDFTVNTSEGEIRIRGETDPVIVDEESQPLLLTEIKTTASVARLDAPRSHHVAQAHAYLYGLSQDYEEQITDALLLYWGRDDFELRAFHVDFDPWFWRSRVLAWTEKNTHYRRTNTLPPASPEHEWECGYCPFRRRCGQTNDSHSDVEPTGFLPLTADYPRDRLIEYLTAYPSAKLTPTLANRYGELAAEYGNYDWRCRTCESEYPVDSIEWDGDTDHLPRCDSCAENGIFTPLTGPEPEMQTAGMEGG